MALDKLTYINNHLNQSTPNGFSGNLIPDSMSPGDNDSGAGYRKASIGPEKIHA